MLLLSLWLASASAPLRPNMVPDEIVSVESPDGWTGQLRHYSGDGPPVLLVHGMGANHYNWDFREEVSLAHALQQDDWDVWVAVLPGDEGTSGPESAPVDFQRLSDSHVPAAIEAVLDHTGASQLYFVGHSMGAMLMYAALEDQPIAAGVAISGAGQFDHPTRLVRLGRRFRGGAGDSAVMGRRFAWTVPFNPVVGWVARRAHTETPMLKGLARHALDDSPPGVRAQITRYTREGEFTREDGTPLIELASDVPVLALSGSRDQLVSLEDAEQTCWTLPSCQFVSLDRYGHIDPVLGSTAAEEVYPLVVGWLSGQADGF